MGLVFLPLARPSRVLILVMTPCQVASPFSANVKDLTILNDDLKLCQIWSKVSELENIDEATKIVETETGLSIGNGLVSGIELREKNEHDRGVFASRFLAKGEVIAVCRPMACISDVEVEECFHNMPSSDDGSSPEGESDSEYDYPDHAAETLLTAMLTHQMCDKDRGTAAAAVEAFVSMFPRTWTEVMDLDYEPVEDERLVRILKEEINPEFLEALGNHGGSAFLASFERMNIEDQIHWLTMKVACNVMACRVDSDSVDDQRRDEFYAVFYLGHFFNHSCVANTVPTHIGDLMVLRTIRDIKPGEELTFSYVPIDDLRDPMDIRNFPLFDCHCEKCALEPEPLKPTNIDDEFTAELLKSIVGEINEQLMEKVTLVLKDMAKLQVSFNEPFMTLASVAVLPTKMPEKINCLEALSLLWSSLKEYANSLWAILLALFMLENKAARQEIKERFRQGAGLFAFVEKAVKLSDYDLAVDDTLIPFRVHVAGIMLKVEPEDTATILWALEGAYEQHRLCYGGGSKLFVARQRQQATEFYSGLETYFDMLKS